MSDDGGLELSEAITMIRRQLLAAQATARGNVEGSVLQFEVGKVSIEFAGEIRRATSGGGSTSFWVLTADAKSEHVRGTTQKVTVELTPVNPDGTPSRIRGGVAAPPPR